MTFDINFWLGFLGILATIIFGILSIYLVKSKKYPGGLTYIPEQTIGLFDSIVKNFPFIAITYNGKNIDPQIVLLKGFIVNTGTIDIKNDMVVENLKLSLPTIFKWLNVKIVDSSKGTKASTTIEPYNELVFHLGLFRKNEFLRFEALAYVPQIGDFPSTSILNSALSIKHRIANTSVEIKPKALELPNYFKLKMLFKIPILIVILGYIFSMGFIKSQMDAIMEFHYYLKEGDSIPILKATPHIDNKVKLKTFDGSDYKTISLQEFNANFQKVEIKKRNSNTFLDFIVVGLLLLSVILSVLYFLLSIVNPFLEYRKIKKLKEILNING